VTERQKAFNVLFLCTGNSARSIFGEVLINHWGGGRFHGYSAGSTPKRAVHPTTLRLLRQLDFPVEGLHSKSWERFSGPDAPRMDFVFTVCDNAAAESCPVWPGQPMTAHWGVRDPVAVTGDEKTRVRAFRTAFKQLENRIRIFVSLPIQTLDRLTLQREVDEIGRIDNPADNGTVVKAFDSR
jgi:protein-tyrosine-phosphatase